MNTLLATLSPYLDLDRKPSLPLLAVGAIGAVMAAFGGLYVLGMLFLDGHAAFNTSSDMAWGLPIAIYLTLLLTSSGLTVLASLDLVFGLEAFHPIAKRCVWLALITLVAGFTVLALEIGHPFRMLWALPFAFQWRSPMWWMGVFYSFDLVLLVVKFWLIHTRRWHGWFPHLVTVVSFVTVICAAGTLGLVFGMMAMRPAWFNPTMPLYFMLTGFLSAIAMITFVVSLTGTRSAAELHLFESHLPRLFMVTLLGVLAMVAGRTITGLWSNYEGFETFGLRFEAFLAMFQNEVIIGLLIPLALMSTNRLRASRLARLVASTLVLIGMFFARFDLLIIGQQVPLFKGSYFFGVDAGTGFVEYWPSTTEWMLVPLGLGMVLFLYAAGQWLLRLSETPQAAPAEPVTRRMQVAQPAE
jgi:formate-dependent nitrite reductase membrane component NrfD